MLRAEGHDFLFAVHNQAQRHALHAAGTELGLDFAPQDGRELKAHQTVQHAAGLLGVHQVHVNVPGVLDGTEDGIFGDFMKDDTAGFALRKAQRLLQVPGDGLSFAVFIGRQPHGGSGLREFFEFGHHFLFVGRDNIFRGEPVGYVYAELVLFQVADVADGCLYQIFLSQVLLDGLHLPGALYNN